MAGVADPGPWPSPMELSSASIEVAKLIELAEAVDGPLSISLPPSLVDRAGRCGRHGTDRRGRDRRPPTRRSRPRRRCSPAPPATPSPHSRGSTPPRPVPRRVPRRRAHRPAGDRARPVVDRRRRTQDAMFTEQLRTGEDVLLRASPRAVVSRAVWYSRGTVSASAMVALRNLGIRMLVVPDSTANELGVSTGPDASGLFAVNLVADGTLPAMTRERSRRAAPDARGRATRSTAANEAAVRLLVELQLQRAATGVPAVVLATPRRRFPTRRSPPSSSSSPRSCRTSPSSRSHGCPGSSTARSPAVRQRRSSCRRRPALTSPSASPRSPTPASTPPTRSACWWTRHEAGRWDAELTRVMSTAIDDATAFEHLGATHAEIERVLGAIVPPDSETLRLTGTSSRLRLRLENTYDQPLNVLIHVRSPKLTFPEPDPLVLIPPGESVLVDVPVEPGPTARSRSRSTCWRPTAPRSPDPVILKARVTRLTGLSQVVTGARRARARVVVVQPHPAESPAPARCPPTRSRSFDDARVVVSPDAAEAMVLSTSPGARTPPGHRAGHRVRAQVRAASPG